MPPPPLRLFLDKVKAKDSIGKFQRKNIKKGMDQIKSSEGIDDPTKGDYIVDISSGYSEIPFARGLCPTITRSRAMQRGFYYTRGGGRRLSMTELARLQGCKTELYDFSSLKPREVGSLAGNAMTVSVMRLLLPRALVAAGLSSEAA